MTSFSNVADRASIAVDGTIVMGRNIICDGFMHQRENSVFTHIHEDHVRNYESSLGLCSVYVTKETKELLLKVKDQTPPHNNLFGVDYGEAIEYDEETITLFPTKHILGSCQVLVQSDNTRILYSSDFDMPGTEPIECDILILDATHGSTEYSRDFDKQKVYNDLLSIINSQLKQEKTVVISAHTGQLQELISTFSTELEKSVPFLAKEKEIALSLIYKNFGYHFKEIIDIAASDAQRILSSQGNLFFMKRTEKLPENLNGACHISISSDIAFRGKPWYQVDAKNKYSFNISNHSDLNGILEYVKGCRPERVITDSFRSYYAPNLAKIIQNSLSIPAKAMPY